MVSRSWNGGADGNGVSRRSFSLQKTQTGDVRFGEDLELAVRVEAFAPVPDEASYFVPMDLNNSATMPTAEYEVVIKADGIPVSGHYARGNNWQIRLIEIVSHNILVTSLS